MVMMLMFFWGTREEVEGWGRVNGVGFGTIGIVIFVVVKFESWGGRINFSVD